MTWTGTQLATDSYPLSPSAFFVIGAHLRLELLVSHIVLSGPDFAHYSKDADGFALLP